MRELPPWDPRRVRLARAGRVLLVAVVVLGAATLLARRARSGEGVPYDVAAERDDGGKSIVEFRFTPEVERRVKEIDHRAARLDADRTLFEWSFYGNERHVFFDGTEVRKIRNAPALEPDRPSSFVYYYDGGYVYLIRVLWPAPAQGGAGEERFYFDPQAMPPLIRWVGRDGLAAKSWSPFRSVYAYQIHYTPNQLLTAANEMRECVRAPTSPTCERQGFHPR